MASVARRFWQKVGLGSREGSWASDSKGFEDCRVGKSVARVKGKDFLELRRARLIGFK